MATLYFESLIESSSHLFSHLLNSCQLRNSKNRFLLKRQSHGSANWVTNMCFEELVHSCSSSVVDAKISCCTVDDRVCQKEQVPSLLPLEVYHHHLATGNLMGPMAESIQDWLIGDSVDIAIVIWPKICIILHVWIHITWNTTYHLVYFDLLMYSSIV